MRVNWWKSRSRSFNLSRFCWVVFWLAESERNRKSETDRLTVLFEVRTALETQYVSLCVCVCVLPSECKSKLLPFQIHSIFWALYFNLHFRAGAYHSTIRIAHWALWVSISVCCGELKKTFRHYGNRLDLCQVNNSPLFSSGIHYYNAQIEIFSFERWECV